MLKSIHSFS